MQRSCIPNPHSSLCDLEKIYSYETIDPSTVRTIKDFSSALQKKTEKPLNAPQPIASTLNFFQTATNAFSHREPLDSLCLSPFALKALKSFSIPTIGLLQQNLLTDRSKFRSIGQSHLEEIELKIKQFLSKPHTPTADLSSAMRLVLSKLPAKERALIVAMYQLKPFCNIPLADEKEADHTLKRMSEKEKNLFFEKNRPQLAEALEMVSELLYVHFISPLLSEHGGILSTSSIELVLFTESGLPSFEKMKQINSFFYTVLPEGTKPWFALFSEYVDSRFVCQTKAHAHIAEEILNSAKTAINLCKHRISLCELSSWIWKQQAKQWNILEKSTIEELLYWQWCPLTILREN